MITRPCIASAPPLGVQTGTERDRLDDSFVLSIHDHEHLGLATPDRYLLRRAMGRARRVDGSGVM